MDRVAQAVQRKAAEEKREQQLNELVAKVEALSAHVIELTTKVTELLEPQATATKTKSKTG